MAILLLIGMYLVGIPIVATLLLVGLYLVGLLGCIPYNPK